MRIEVRKDSGEFAEFSRIAMRIRAAIADHEARFGSKPDTLIMRPEVWVALRDGMRPEMVSATMIGPPKFCGLEVRVDYNIDVECMVL